MIHAGFVHFQLNKPIDLSQQNLITNINSLRPFIDDDADINKLDLVTKLERSDIIHTSIFFQSNVKCSIQINVIEEQDQPLIQQNYNSDHTLLLQLLSFINRSINPTQHLSPFEHVRFSSLLNIFIHLPSPLVDPKISGWCDNLDIIDFLNQDVQVKIPGMKTTLYNYQRHSLWKILQRELAPALIEEYQVIKLTAVDGSNYYFNQLTGEIRSKAKLIHDAKGGIICEDMGTGKTCICLATIMATKDLSNPVDYHDKDLKTDMPKKTVNNVPTLKAIMAERLQRLGVNWKPIKSQLPIDVVEAFQKYPMYYKYTDIPTNYNFERSRRVVPTFTTLTVYLSNATLVVVPDNLVAQWTGEIYKHIQDGQLKFLIYDDTKQKILPPIELADYDLIVISQSRFSYENYEGGLDFKSQVCNCSFIWSTGKRACMCSMSESKTYVSPILQVHWKRLIVDEGHRLSSKNRQSELSSKLFSNWKWICTGTPTQNLTESASARTRQESELDDLNRLGALYGQVLSIEPFKSNKKLWYRLISKPFLENKPWAIAKLTHIMEHTMIRNQRSDMDKEVTLPPLHQTTIYLDFDYYQWMAHNCQIAMISLNAILSRRDGADYLFSSKNAKSLRETVHNLWQSCLWFSIDLKQLDMAYSNGMEKLLEVEQGTCDYGHENKDLKEIVHVLKRALDDSMFMCIMTQHSPSYVVQGLPPLFRETWGWLGGDHGAYLAMGELPWDDHCVLSAERVVDTMQVVKRDDGHKDLFVYNGIEKTLNSVQKKKKDVVEDGQFTYYTRNAFSDARVLQSSSVKINYLVNQICKYQAKEKCIIFAQHYNEMYEIYLALELAKVRVLMYQDSRMNNAKRSQMILTFNTSENANVIIMAVQKAAYGIDLSSATRVFFVSPVWQTAMEQQAIKRAHRIGQTRPVYIETLVIRNTIEDELLKRRDQVSKGNEQELQKDKENWKRGDFFRDSKLQNILNHAHFVPLPDTVSKDEQGKYRQKIVPLDAPLDFVPKKHTVIQEDFDLELSDTETPDQTETTLTDPQSSDSDELLLDIEGDHDVMDHVRPWKTRIVPEKRRVQTEEPNKKKKSVRFA